jgi:hypothetical protein
MNFVTRTRILPLAAVAIFLLGLFSPEIYDTDFWWHLRTGQYIVETRSLPSPDPFAWTTATARDTYAGESRTRRFNLTHEWLAQSVLYSVWRAAGFAGVVAMRAVSMTLVCGLVGLVAWRRSNFSSAIAAALPAGAVLATLALDRPYQVTFLFLAATLAILEYRRGLWLLPPMFLIWANCHGGFFLGWVALGAHCAESILRRKRDAHLWAVSAASIAISAINPNGLAIFRTLLDYRSSFMQSKLLEWTPPRLWPLSWFSALLFVAAIALALEWRKVRPADWLIFLAFAAASLTAQRNLFLTALVAPPLIATYLPIPDRIRKVRRAMPAAAALIAALVVATTAARGAFFQFRVAEWKWPSGAAAFLAQHHVTGRMFNTYEYGGYLIWRLFPRQRVFIDGRALSEAVFQDYARILYNHDNSDGLPDATQILNSYGVDTIVMNTFEPSGGTIYLLAPSLADPNQTTWKLVYQDARALIFMRTPPTGVAPLNSAEVLTHLEAECATQIEHEPQYARCARSLGQIFTRIGDYPRARKWVGTYLQYPHDPDPQAEEAWQRLIGTGQ